MGKKVSLSVLVVSLSSVFLFGCSAGQRSDNGAAPIVSHKLGDVKSYAMQEDSDFSGDELNFEGSENFSQDMRAQIGHLNKKVYFGFDKFKVSSKDSAVVKQNAGFLLNNSDIPVMLTGNTDPRGSSSYNLHLGQRRAESVKAMLAKEGVPKDQICTVSYGELRPAAIVDNASGNWEKAYKLDRRVEFIYGQRCDGAI